VQLHIAGRNLWNINSPGWLVMSIKENWPAPLGYDDYEENKYKSCPECGGPKGRNGFYHNRGPPAG
jgi:hypothetical protein